LKWSRFESLVKLKIAKHLFFLFNGFFFLKEKRTLDRKISELEEELKVSFYIDYWFGQIIVLSKWDFSAMGSKETFKKIFKYKFFFLKLENGKFKTR
jgi:hypothetical protein